jgi:hypothetical protein
MGLYITGQELESAAEAETALPVALVRGCWARAAETASPDWLASGQARVVGRPPRVPQASVVLPAAQQTRLPDSWAESFLFPARSIAPFDP